MNVIINKCYGGYGLSNEAIALYLTKKGIEYSFDGRNFIVDDQRFFVYTIQRHDPVLIEVIKELGNKANGSCAELQIISIPKHAGYSLDEYDGMETIETWMTVTTEQLLKGLTPQQIKELKSVDSVRIN
jgi:hypothetical protein